MKYEFHVGDYVETKDGDIGLITEIDTDEDSFWYGSSYWYCTSSRGPRHEKRTYIIPDGTDADMARIFNRIGQYDFTKQAEDKNNDKIEPLCEEYTKSFPVCEVTNMGYTSECYSFDLGVVGKKINELVEVVNSLEEKVHGMAQS